MGGFMGRRKVPLYMRPPDAEKKGVLAWLRRRQKGKEKKTALKRQKCHQPKAVSKREKNNDSSFVTVIPSASATLRFSEVHS